MYAIATLFVLGLEKSTNCGWEHTTVATIIFYSNDWFVFLFLTQKSYSMF